MAYLLHCSDPARRQSPAPKSRWRVAACYRLLRRKVWRVPRKYKLWTAGVIMVLTLLCVGAVLFTKWWPRHRHRQSEALTQQAYVAWHKGEFRAAELCFETAIECDSHNLRAALLLGRMWFETDSTAMARSLFMKTLDRTSGEGHALVASCYNDTAIAAGAWDQLASLGYIQLGETGRPVLAWLVPTIEGIRLSHLTPERLDERTFGRRNPDPISNAFIRAQFFLNAKSPTRAEAQMDALKEPLSPVLALVACRMWLKAGEPDRARRALAQVSKDFSAADLLVSKLAFAGENPDEALTSLRVICRAPEFIRKDSPLPEAAVSQLFPYPNQLLAHELYSGLVGRSQQLSPSTAAGLWLYSSLSGAEKETKYWADWLEAHTKKRPAAMPSGWRLTTAMALPLFKALPLERPILYSLVSAIEADAEKK